ncbi:MAG: SulP family inorganic anion transporter [Planctomycetaceae bacterium]|nr:SulP family inorganic anion transporter [Planctomycetaceae bacterium]MBT5123600.1 SulP family inorganic anion transporter [Planctomycetaceae bacterium]
MNVTDLNETPRGDLAGFVKYLKQDVVSGFLVFLIALPLCLGIALACGYPAIAGIFTAIIGSILATFISNSELTIKGPAAGLIVIAYGCVRGFGGEGFATELSADEFDVAMTAYRMALAVGVVAAVLQIFFGLFRAGILGEFFPLSAVHGMLAAIGIIIMVKQIPAALGVVDKELLEGEPLELIAKIPQFFAHMNPEIALIGGVGIALMFVWPWVQKLHVALKAVPAAMVVLVATVPLGMYFDLLHKHTYSFHGHTYEVGETYLVNMPDRVFGMFDYITTPDFSAFTGDYMVHALTYVFLFFVIGSLESLLSAKAVDVIDPWKRKTNLDRDMVAVGAGNLACACVGGLPMISEIVRSKANIDNGARTRFANMWHGIFLLLCVALIPTVLHRIPIAALAAMLIYTGFRLTHPKEFLHVYQIGKEQLLIFVATLVGVLATDLLWGILIGIGVKLLIHVINGVPLWALFKPYLDIEVKDDDTAVIRARHSAVFSNWILFRSKIIQLGLVERRNVVVDFSQCKLVDHSVMEKVHELERDFEDANLHLAVEGLEGHKALSHHDFAARKQAMTRLQRVTVVADESLEESLIREFVKLGASGYTSIPCHGAGRRSLAEGDGSSSLQIRLEAVVLQEVADQILDYLRAEVAPNHRITACVEAVEVLRQDNF